MQAVAAPWLRRFGALFRNGDERRLRALWRLATLAALLAGLGSLGGASGLLPTGTSGASYLIRVEYGEVSCASPPSCSIRRGARLLCRRTGTPDPSPRLHSPVSPRNFSNSFFTPTKQPGHTP
jgi:hypothetical protein